ncbi:MAG: (Fe-S)-binding protein [Geminicoccaceae bacterium]|nr:(Fe-S)-binding protein [Geminicoccaceae bacterium]MCS7267476.1 (Fe-S)-binding protein [Geminicoccaceae bacterium]MCX7629157.1 (Fe-S)-binding protein [Geminicoccaceae bacterium]MDW8123680.1 (Fe-S)-binding protein [Geminicoccaceae bacterium]MDW8342414.1 (Fe-S)-binding protein [Geminicoccaceae bacterium]
MADSPRVALFVTCLVDLFRPSVGWAAVELLEKAGCRVEVPEPQICCGQPAFNSGDRRTTEELARQTIPALEPYDFVVAPSGSCAGMLRRHFPELFDDDPAWKARARAVADKSWELVSFLVDVRGMSEPPGGFAGRVTYHDSCSGLRELGIKAQPRALLRAISELELVEMEGCEVCCGFGGTFCVKYPEISTKMVEDKARRAEATGAELLLAGDLGCLMNIAGRLARRNSTLAVRHVAEVLAGRLETPPIGVGRVG